MTAKSMLFIYDKVKKFGRMGVEASIWLTGEKFVRSLTPLEVKDFQQMWLSTDEDVRSMAFLSGNVLGRPRHTRPLCTRPAPPRPCFQARMPPLSGNFREPCRW